MKWIKVLNFNKIFLIIKSNFTKIKKKDPKRNQKKMLKSKNLSLIYFENLIDIYDDY